MTLGTCWQGASCAWMPFRNLCPKSRTSFPIAQHHQPIRDVDARQSAALGFPFRLGGWG